MKISPELVDPPLQTTKSDEDERRRGVLLAVVYADLFDFALSHDELLVRVIGVQLDRARLTQCLSDIGPDILYDTGKFVCLRGRERLIRLRRRREMRARLLWKQAQRYAGWLRFVPFVRSVAVSGSLAVRNAGPTCDVDLFCITASNRLWISRLFIVPLARLTRRTAFFDARLCPNYLLDESCLRVPDENLFTAHEIVQAVPLWGKDVHTRFRHANRWTSRLLPNTAATGETNHRVPEPPRPFLTRIVERMLLGRVGDALNRLLYSAFVQAYRARASLRGWCWMRIAPAYKLGRYTVPEGGYAGVVACLFQRRIRKALGCSTDDAHLAPFFPPE